MSTSNSEYSKAFKRTYLMVCAVLGIACLMLAVLTMTQGPRLRRVSLDAKGLTADLGNRLVLHTNQSLETVDTSQITISPYADFTTFTSNRSLSIQFSERLLYNTEYTIVVEDIASKYRQAASTVQYVFRTEAPTIYYIRTGVDSSDDEIVATTLEHSEESTIFSAKTIQDYALLNNKLLVSTLQYSREGESYSQLSLVDIKTGETTELLLPGRGTLSHLKTSPDKRRAGFSFSGTTQDNSNYQNAVFTIDLAANRSPILVNGLNDTPLSAVNWQFASDGTTIIALSQRSGELLMADSLLQNQPMTLGEFKNIGNTSYDGAKLIVIDKTNETILLDLLTHTKIPLTVYFSGEFQSSLQNARLLANDEGVIKQHYNANENAYYLELSKNGRDTIIYKNTESPEQIIEFTTSPNDQYIAVETTSASAVDQTTESPTRKNTTTKIIETDNKKIQKTINGSRITWH